MSATSPKPTREPWEPIAAPRKAANVNSGPGRAWAKPYPARNVGCHAPHRVLQPRVPRAAELRGPRQHSAPLG